MIACAGIYNMKLMLQLHRFLVFILLFFLCNGAHAETLAVNGSRFEVEVARTPQEQENGLMFRRKLAPNHGMLFLFSPPRDVGMWMKNTYVPLDMFFIRGGKIVRIAENATPESLKLISSGQPVSAVLEVPGGTAQRIGVKAGDKVVMP